MRRAGICCPELEKRGSEVGDIKAKKTKRKYKRKDREGTDGSTS